MEHRIPTSTSLGVVGGDDVEWLYRILIEAPPGASALGDDRPILRHKAIPNDVHPQLLVPCTSPRAAAAAVAAYAGLRRLRSRFTRRAGGLVLRAVGQLALRHEVSASIPAGLLADLDPGEVSLLEHLRGVLVEPDLLAAIRLVPTHRMPKPGLLLLRPDGTVIGYTKVGWEALSRRSVEREASVLTELDLSGARWLAAPRVLYAGDWQGRSVLVTSPLPPDVRRLGRRDPDPLEVARDVPRAESTGRAEIADSAYWRQLLADLAELEAEPAVEPAMLRAAARLVDEIGARYSDVELEWGRWHGDWTTWNLAAAGGRVWAWDWEFSSAGRPLGFDVLQHVVQHALIRKDMPLAQALAAAAARTGEWLGAGGAQDRAVAATAALHRLELLRREARWAGLVRPDPRFDPEVLANLPRGSAGRP